jgi:hypothetical protein
MTAVATATTPPAARRPDADAPHHDRRPDEQRSRQDRHHHADQANNDTDRNEHLHNGHSDLLPAANVDDPPKWRTNVPRLTRLPHTEVTEGIAGNATHSTEPGGPRTPA